MMDKPRLCFVGPMVGRNPGYVTTQGLVLSDRFASEGYEVLAISSQTNRYVRFADIVRTLILRGRNYDIQCLEIYGGPSFVVEDVASLIGSRTGQRVIMWLHGGALPEFMARFPKWTRRVFKRAACLVTPSAFLARAVEAHGFQARIIPNLVDLDGYPFRERVQVSPRLFWMRTFHPVWNPEMAVRVLADLRKDVPDAQLVMAGQDAGSQHLCVELAGSLNLHSAVRFAGFLNREAKFREFDNADIFVSTNRIDNTPVAIIEACAAGLPVVATGVGGVPDLIDDGHTGVLTPDNDVPAMADAIRRLLREPALARALSVNGRLLAEKSSWENVRNQWERLFAAVTGESEATR